MCNETDPNYQNFFDRVVKWGEIRTGTGAAVVRSPKLGLGFIQLASCFSARAHSMSSSHYLARPQAFQVGPTKLSARSSYPIFLSLQDSVILQLTWAWRGLYDSFRWGAFVITVAR